MRYLWALALIAGVTMACEATLDESLTDFQTGDCVMNPGFGEYEELDRVDCTEPGSVKVVGMFDIEGYSDEFPGNSAIDDEAYDGCPASMEWYLVPTKDSWEMVDDRLVVCFAEN